MGVAGNTTDLKLADTAGKRAKARGTLAQWNERRAVLQGQQDAVTNELAQLDAEGRADLGLGNTAHIDLRGFLRINHGNSIAQASVLALRDHLCKVLGLPDCFQGLTTLTEQEAADLARELIDHRVGDHQKHRDSQVLNRALAETAIFDALDHVGVIQSENPLTTRASGTPASQQEAPAATVGSKPEAIAAPAGTAGSAQGYTITFDSSSIERVMGILNDTAKVLVSVVDRNRGSALWASSLLDRIHKLTGTVRLETKPSPAAPNPNAASEDWDALHGINVDGNIGKQVDVSA